MLNFKKFYMKKTIFGTKLTYLKIELTQLSYNIRKSNSN